MKVESEDIDLGEPSSVEAEEEVVHITGEAEGVYKVPQIKFLFPLHLHL